MEDRTNFGFDNAKTYLDNVIKGNEPNIINDIDIVENKQVAIDIAEIILFNFYGEDEILDEKPYEIYLINEIWVIFGTLPKNYLGGTFKICINKKNGQVISICHDQ